METKFKGQRIDNQKWVCGGIKILGDDIFIIAKQGIVLDFNHEVAAKTVCQFINLHDKTGAEIYENSVLKFQRIDGSCIYYKIFRVKGGFAINIFQDDFKKDPKDILFYESTADPQTASFIEGNLEVIGTVFEIDINTL